MCGLFQASLGRSKGTEVLFGLTFFYPSWVSSVNRNSISCLAIYASLYPITAASNMALQGTEERGYPSRATVINFLPICSIPSRNHTNSAFASAVTDHCATWCTLEFPFGPFHGWTNSTGNVPFSMLPKPTLNSKEEGTLLCNIIFTGEEITVLSCMRPLGRRHSGLLALFLSPPYML